MAKSTRASRRRKPRRPIRARKAKRTPAKTRRSRRATRRPTAKQARKQAARRAAPKRKARNAAKRPAPRRREPPPSTLARSRRQLPDSERLASSGLSGDRLIQAARAGHDEMRIRMQHHTETSPALTADDPDARWEEAYAIGDEAPGGDNPTPDQDRVDDIGKALGIRYRTDEELKGGEEVAERDRKRWELDPASSEDWPHDDGKKR